MTKKQCSVDIFIIDWERSRGKVLSSQEDKPDEAPVSVWRSIFMANHWNSLQVKQVLLLWVSFVKDSISRLPLFLPSFFLKDLAGDILQVPRRRYLTWMTLI
jgi:hypothetical protein